MNNPVVICLVPVKNESWIIDKFIRATSLWADKIIVAYQKSTDNTLKICKKYKNVIIIDNKNTEFNEPERQKILIEESRKIYKNKKHVIIALDADEFITLNDKSLKELEKIKKLKKGTIIKFGWKNIMLNENTYWNAPNLMPFGFVDDNSTHEGLVIHSPRIPIPLNAPVYTTKYLNVMHYQYADWDRMESKHRWYQCWELLNNPLKKPLDIYRQYHHMYSISPKNIFRIPEIWYQAYEKSKIDLKTIPSERRYYWDGEVLKYLNRFGSKKFNKISIWDIDWKDMSSKYGYKQKNTFIDSRNIFQKIIQQYLKKTQKYYSNMIIKYADSIIRQIY